MLLENNARSLIDYGKYFAYPQISLEPIRRRQDPELAQDIIKLSKTRLAKTGANKVKEPMFFVGSVDFMVKNEGKDKTFYVLESNGGNSRGFSAMPVKQWLESYEAYAQSLRFVESEKPTILIGHPNKDLLLYEKIFLAEYIAQNIKKKAPEAEVVHAENITGKRLRQGNLVIIGPYKDILPRISIYKNNYVYFDGKKIDVLIGDGIARRKSEIVEHLIKNDLKSLVINDIFFLTDDKALTYMAVEESAHLLANYNVKPIAFRRAETEKKLKEIINDILDEIPEVLIKPHGGSGGSGIDIIYNKEHVQKKIKASKEHYKEKFGPKRNPYPYTVCQRVEATPIEWNDALHHYDIRIYVGRIKDRIVPLGALMRIALEPFSGQFNKKSFVVNLSGYEGVDTDRGFGLHKDSLKLFNLDKNDFAKMFSASCALSAFMSNNYQKLIKKALEDEKNQN